ncbi:MAG: EcsC family protein [Lachnospiraceae bacterium]|nr:EcsC family protein [Lachnospiraceae bacterium]
MSSQKSPLEKEWLRLLKQEQSYMKKSMEKKDSKLNLFLAGKVPEKLQGTLDNAFSKAFYVVFEKGTGVIEKTYRKEDTEKTYQINEYASRVREDRKSLKAFSKKAAGSCTGNLVLSGVSGIGLGALGIGLPDIVLFTGLVLKSVYQIALNYGFDYMAEKEKLFILVLIQGALAHGEELLIINGKINQYIEKGDWGPTDSLEEGIRTTAGFLSKELLYMKFLQGIPIAGVVGGAYDVIYLKQIVKYAELKYRRRFYDKRRSG